MVFMLAIVFAFASDNKSSNRGDAPISGFIMQSGLCVPTTKNCDQVNAYFCKYNGQQVYLLRDSATSCSVKLFHSQED
jgi:hypothetical protein